MGFIAWLALLYFLLIVIVIFSFKKNAKTIGIITLIIMVLGAAGLGYLWLTSPM